MQDIYPPQQKKPIKKVFIIVLFCLLAVLVVSYFLFWEKAKNQLASMYVSYLLSKFTGGKVEVKDGGKKITYDQQGTEYTLEQGGEVLPEVFPKDFPVFPGAVLVNSTQVKEDGSVAVSVIWESEKPMSEIAQYYQTKIPASGWQIIDKYQQDSYYTLSLKKDDKNGLLGLTLKDQKVSISATLNIQ